MNKKEKLIHCSIFIVCCLYFVFTCYPTGMFNHTLKHRNYQLHLAHPGLAEAACAVIDSVDSKLKESELYDTPAMHIALCNDHFLYSLLTHISYSSFGVTQLLSNFIILSKTDLKSNLVTANRKENNQRSIASVLLHEITHILISNRYGLQQFSINEWKKEGYCEYMAQQSSFDIEQGYEYFMQGVIEKNPSYLYFKYRLYMTYLMDVKQLSFSRIAETEFNKKELEAEIRRYIQANGVLFNE